MALDRHKLAVKGIWKEAMPEREIRLPAKYAIHHKRIKLQSMPPET